MAIKLAIVDDHPLLIKGLCSVMQHFADIEITGTYLNEVSLFTGLAMSQPDVLLLDLQLKGSSGEELAQQLAKKYPDITILVFPNMEQEYFIKTLLSLGVKGYVLKSSDELVLLQAIRAVYNGYEFFDPAIRERVINARKGGAVKSVLTRREKEVLKLIARDYNSTDIATKLFLSKRTVDNHRTNLLLKLKVNNSAGLVKKATDLGLLK